MNYLKNNKLFCIAIVLTLLAYAAVAVLMVRADDSPTICRDTSWASPRYIVYNVPQSWIDTQWWFVADGAGVDGNTITLDGDVVHVGTGSDTDIGLVGDASTPSCGTGEYIEPTTDVGVAGAPGACYYAYLDSYLLTDEAHPDGIVWVADSEGYVHIITGGGDQSTEAGSYYLEVTDCQ